MAGNHSSTLGWSRCRTHCRSLRKRFLRDVRPLSDRRMRVGSDTRQTVTIVRPFNRPMSGLTANIKRASLPAMSTAEINSVPSRPLALERRDVLLSVLIAASFVIFWRQIADTFQLAWHVDEYTHILLILPVSLTLIYLQRGKLRSNATYAPAAGVVLGVFSIAIGFAATHSYNFTEGISLALAIFSMVMFWTASIVGCYGWNVFKSLLFPFLFLFLLIPPPASLVDKAVSFLQTASTDATFALFNLTGSPIIRNGYVLTLPNLSIEVARECSGIRSSIMLLITGLILAHLFLRSTWSKIVFVLIIVPLSVAKNAIRIFTLTMLAMYVDPGFLSGRLHHQGGIVFFLIALGGLLLSLWILQRAESPRMKPPKSIPAV
jgi:exosortase